MGGRRSPNVPVMQFNRLSWMAAIRARREQSVLSFSPNPFLIGKLLLGKLSKAVVVHGNAPPCALPRESSDRQLCELPPHECANAQGPRQSI